MVGLLLKVTTMGKSRETILLDGKASLFEEQIKRFRRTYRRRLRKLANLAEPLADLVVSFPAAAFALVTEYGTVGQRHEAIKAVKQGLPLKRVAAALGLPFWMRKLPPEALVRHLPAKLPQDAEFGARLVGMVPMDVDKLGGWLAAVLEAHDACDASFALWVARYPESLPPAYEADAVRLLGVYAWYSEQTGTAAGKLMLQRWNDRVSMKGAVARLQSWWVRLRQDIFLGENGVADPWLAGGSAAGYRIRPLLTMADLEAEAEAMSSCVMDYAWKMANGQCRLFSVRRGSARVATVEIGTHPLHAGIPVIAQLYGPDNEPAPDRVWAAVFTWLGKQGEFDLPCPDETAPVPPVQAWQRLWRPYWREKGYDHLLLPETPNRETLPAINRRLEVLGNAVRHLARAEHAD